MRELFARLLLSGSFVFAFVNSVFGLGDALSIPLNARDIVIGKTFSGLSPTKNPASLSLLSGASVGVFYGNSYSDIYTVSAYGHKAFKFGTMQFQMSMNSYGEINGTSVEGYAYTPSETFSAYDLAGAVRFGRLEGKAEKLGWGVTLEFVREQIADFSSFSVAVSGGIIYDSFPAENFTVGTAIIHLGLPMKLHQQAFMLPTEFGVAIGYSKEFEALKFGAKNINVSASFRYPFTENPKVSLTAEVGFYINSETTLSARLSKDLQIYGSEENDILLNIGAGITYRNIDISYAMLPSSNIETCHFISVEYRFGTVERKKALGEVKESDLYED